jgi:hypothetical protein
MRFYMKRKSFLAGLFPVLLFACSRMPSRLEQALALAGANRAELEKALAHYSADAADSLKYRAACFLIENMIGHHELSSPATDSLKSVLNREKFNGMTLMQIRKIYGNTDVYTDTVRQKFKTGFKEKYGSVPSGYTVKPDLKYITCDYLVRNIDVSFRIWEDVPWRDAISFDDFCEEILPYRVSNEALEDWKETYHRKFRPAIDSVRDHRNIKEICRTLRDFLSDPFWIYESNFYTPGLGPLTMLESRLGNCKEQAEFTAYVLMSLGIPAGIDRIVQNANYYYLSHYWNSIREPDGNRFYIEFNNLYDKIEDFNRDRHYGKIYRAYYGLQPASLPMKLKGKHVPPVLASPFLADVSHEYFPHVNITIEPDGKTEKGEIVFLDVFDGNRWTPTGWTETGREKRRVRFCHVEPNVLYRVSAIRDGQQVPLTDPFILKGDENACFMRADTERLQEMKLTRKFRTTSSWKECLNRAVGGKFQGANRVDFADAVTLHETVDPPSLDMTVLPVHHAVKFNYVRYISPDSSGNSIAELWFMSDGKPLHGTVICSNSRDEQGRENIMDDDPLTRFNLKEKGSWIGLALEHPRQINEIRFQYWNDDNSIRRGDEYELFYWAGNKWNSLGRQTGSDTHVLEYKNGPAGALFLLHNHTRGREERPFTYENGKQFFW